MQTEQTDFLDVRGARVEDLRRRVGAGTYDLPGETLAESLMSLPVGALTKEQLALLTEPIRRENKRAARRAAGEDGRQGWCNLHQCAYPVVHGHRALDCNQCFDAKVREAVQKLKAIHDAERMGEVTPEEVRAKRRLTDYQQRREAFMQEAGMQQDAGFFSSPSQMLFGGEPKRVDVQKPLSWQEWGVIALFTGAVLTVVYMLAR